MSGYYTRLVGRCHYSVYKLFFFIKLLSFFITVLYLRFNLLFILDMFSFDYDVINFLWSPVMSSTVMSEALNSFSRCLIITVSRDHEGDKTK